MKALLDFLKGNYSFHAGEFISMGENGWWKGVTGWGGGETAGIPVTQDSAMASSTVFACTRALSETLATLPATVMEQQDLETRRKARENAMWALLHDQPNPRMDATTWYGLNATRVINRGNAVNIIERNGRGLPIALWPVHNSRWEVYCEPSRAAPGGRYYPGGLYYKVYPDSNSNGYIVGPDEVLNVVGWDTENGVTARGVIDRMRNEISLDLAQGEYAGSMFRNGAIPLGFIKHPMLDDANERQALRDDINRVHQGRENWNKVGLLWDKDAEWMGLNFSPRDVQAIETRTFSAKSICRGYNVPPAIVQIFDDYKFSTVEAMLKQFVMLGLRPLGIRFERAIGTQVLSTVDDFALLLEFALEGLLRGDPKTQADIHALYRSWGILNGDEIRQGDLGMNPMENGLGAIRLAPVNYAPLELVASGKAIPPTNNDRPSRRNGSGSGDGEETETRADLPRWDRAHLAALAGTLRRDRLPAPPSGREQTETTTLDTPAVEVVTMPGKEAYARYVVERRLSYMANNEHTSLLSRARKGSSGFLTWCEQYYQRFQENLTDALHLGCEGLYDTPNEALVAATRLSALHVAESKRQLLLACECDQAAFLTAITNCVSAWPDRKPLWEKLDEA